MVRRSEVIDHPFRNFEHAGWEQAAAAYAETFGTVTSLFAPALLDAAGLRENMGLLEVACGSGFVAAAAAARGARATGVDFSANMVAEARKRYPALRFQNADAEELPFPDAAFDCVVINFGVHHFPFPQRALCEAHRVLRAGGRAAFTVWAAPEQNALHGIVTQAIREAGDAGVALPASPSGTVTETATCRQLLLEAGFDSSTLQVGTTEALVSVASARSLIDIFVTGAVRMAAVIKSQPREKLPGIFAAAEKAAERYRGKEGLRIPATAILAVGTK